MEYLSKVGYLQWTRLQRLARDKHSSLFPTFITHRHKKFYKSPPGRRKLLRPVVDVDDEGDLVAGRQLGGGIDGIKALGDFHRLKKD